MYRENEEIAKKEVEVHSAAVKTNVDPNQEGKTKENESETNGDMQKTLNSSVKVQTGERAPNGEGDGPTSEVMQRMSYDLWKDGWCLIPHPKGILGVVMLRERVDVFGQVRPMEPEEDIQALNIPARLIGIIKEEPVKRWLTGQELWDKRFHKAALQTIQQREHYEKKYATLLETARSQGLELVGDHQRPSEYRRRRASTMSNESMLSTNGEVVQDRRYGPFDVEDERPASSAIVGRRDNVGALLFMHTRADVIHVLAGVYRARQEMHLLHSSSDTQERTKALSVGHHSRGL